MRISPLSVGSPAARPRKSRSRRLSEAVWPPPSQDENPKAQIHASYSDNPRKYFGYTFNRHSRARARFCPTISNWGTCGGSETCGSLCFILVTKEAPHKVCPSPIVFCSRPNCTVCNKKARPRFAIRAREFFKDTERLYCWRVPVEDDGEIRTIRKKLGVQSAKQRQLGEDGRVMVFKMATRYSPADDIEDNLELSVLIVSAFRPSISRIPGRPPAAHGEWSGMGKFTIGPHANNEDRIQDFVSGICFDQDIAKISTFPRTPGFSWAEPRKESESRYAVVCGSSRRKAKTMCKFTEIAVEEIKAADAQAKREFVETLRKEKAESPITIFDDIIAAKGLEHKEPLPPSAQEFVPRVRVKVHEKDSLYRKERRKLLEESGRVELEEMEF